MVNVNGLAAVLTGIEVVVLVQWLRLTTTAAAAVAAGFLVVGILIEELVRFRGIKGRFPQARELDWLSRAWPLRRSRGSSR